MTIDILQKSRKILAVVFLTVAVLLFAAASIYFNLVTFPLFALFILSVVISLLLGAYLAYPSKFEKISIIAKIAKVLSVPLAIVGFGISTLMLPLAFTYYESYYKPPENIIIFIFREWIFATLPLWAMGILALLSLKKDKFEEMENSYKLRVLVLIVIIVFLVLYVLLRFMYYALFLD